jgi:hypothetical protein
MEIIATTIVATGARVGFTFHFDGSPTENVNEIESPNAGLQAEQGELASKEICKTFADAPA